MIDLLKDADPAIGREPDVHQLRIKVDQRVGLSASLGPVQKQSRRPWLIAIAACAVVVAVVAIPSLLRQAPTSFFAPRIDPGQEDVPFEQMATIRQVVDAINARDAEAFIASFRTEGHFNPRGDFRESSSLFGQQLPVADVPLVHAWMAIIDAWDFEAELIDCNLLTEADDVAGSSGPGALLVRCDVATRWHRLSMEITEAWVYEFRGTQLDNWGGIVLLDLNPGERALPLGYDGLEAWEAWLEANHPEYADRYLNPRPGRERCDGCEEWAASLAPNDPELAARLARLLSPAEKEWSIDGHEFTPLGLIPYDPALADEIETSIREYLDTR